MPHIHENGNDFVVDVYVVHKNRVLLRLHDKHNKWLVPGGHIELDETPEEAARREVKEEVGLDIVLWDPRAHKVGSSKGYQDIIPPVHMNMHEINERHKHISHIYFATTVSDETAEQENEKSGGLKWCNFEDLANLPELSPTVRNYAEHALKVLGSQP